MSFNYKNPISPLSSLGNISVQRQNVFGTNFSILSTGGYMEVYNINELYYTIPPSTTGLIEYTGNTIPIQLNKGTGSPFSFDVLTLNSDNISSGRRRLGMLVYVIDQDQVYQYQIPNFVSLWNSATGATGPGGNTVIFSDFGTTIKSNTPEGISFISAWTSNVIEGVSGGTSVNSVWKKLVTGGGAFTGGTVTGDTIFTSGLTANTFSASTYLGLPGDIFITGGTFDNNTDTLTLDRSSGSSIVVTGFTDYYTTGATLFGQTVFFDRNDSLSAYSVNLSAFSPTLDVHVTGATYDNANTFTFTNNTGGTFDVSFDFVTGLTINGDLTVTGNTNVQGLTATTISATTYQNLPIDPDTYITAFTYSSNTLTINDNSGNTFSSTINDFTGLTVNGDFSVTGNTNVQGLTATTISATTYQNLPIDPDTFTTGYTYNDNTFTIKQNNGQPDLTATINTVTGMTVNGDLTVTGNTLMESVTATTISATTYQNLPTDVFVTGGTYTSGNAIFTNNTGGTFNVSGFAIGGGGGQIFYLNLSQPQGGNRFLSTTASTTSEQTSGVTINSGLSDTIASFQSQPLNTTLLPGGIWSFYLHSYKQNTNASFNIFVELYKITSGGSQTFLFTTDPTPVTTNSPTPSMQLSDGYFSGTPLSLSDSIVATVRATNTGNQSHSVTLFTEGSNHYSYVVSTIPTQQGLTCDTLSGCTTIVNLENNKVNKSGDTMTGTLIVPTISATTYQNLPIDPDIYVTAFTYNNNTFTIDDNSGTTFNTTINDVTGLTINGDLTVTGNTSVQGLTATTISATTYQGLPTDIRVTGGTYTAGTTTFTNNTGGTFTVTGFTSQDTFTTAFTYSNNSFTILRNQGQPNLTATINIMTGLTVNGNLTVTGNTNVQALTGTSAYLSGSGQNILTVVGSGSSTSSPLMVVSGSSGELFSITDSLVGTLFSVNNLTGNPILSVDSSDIILMGNYLSPSLNSTIKVSASTGTTNVYSIPTSAYTGAFFDYTVNDGTNLRAGNIMSIWSGTTVQYSETSTTDIGNTSGITFNLTISSGNAILRTSGTTSGWTVKTIIRSI